MNTIYLVNRVDSEGHGWLVAVYSTPALANERAVSLMATRRTWEKKADLEYVVVPVTVFNSTV